MISFISLFVRVTPESVLYSLLNLYVCLFRNIFSKFLAISVPFLARLDKIFRNIGMSRRTLRNYAILDN